MRGKRSCHSGYRNDFAGWLAPIHALKKANLIKSEDDVAELFAGSCAPGAQPGSKLCRQCVGNNDDKVTEATKCKLTEAEAFKGGQGSILRSTFSILLMNKSIIRILFLNELFLVSDV